MSALTRDEIVARIGALDQDPGWYQNIDLKNGLSTKTRQVWGEEPDHPRARWEAIRPAFPESFEGKSVLDLGCNAGFFSFIAAERGARHVCAIDRDPRYIEQAKFCNEVRGDNVDFRVGEATTLPFKRGAFDITLCIGLLYHVRDIMGAIQEIARVTRDMAIVESAVFGGHEDLPLVFVADQKRPLPGTWHPNIAGLRKMFELARFSRTEPIFSNGYRGGIVAYK